MNKRTTSWIFRTLGIWICFLVLVPVVHGKTIYVDATHGAPGNDGLSWATAKDTIIDAISIAAGSDAIWIAEGTYIENPTLIDSLSLYGGYPAGGGTRDFRAHETIIDGDDVRTVVTGARGAVIDGFTIINGSGTYPMIWPGTAKGGGIIAFPEMTITNNIFKDNFIVGDIEIRPRGGAIYVDGAGVCYIANNFFYGNEIGFMGDGAAIYMFLNNSRIINNTFVSNAAVTIESIVAFYNATPQIKNNIFVSNDGVAIRELTAGLSGHSITHNDFFNNSAVYDDRDSLTTFTDVAVMDSTVPEAEDNMDCDPAFIATDDFHLGPGSCCIDIADPSVAPAADLDGDSRPMGAGFDVGADEVAPIDIPVDRWPVFLFLIGLVTLFFLIPDP